MTKAYTNQLKARIILLGYSMGEWARMINERGERCESSDLSRALNPGEKLTPKNSRVIEQTVVLLREKEKEATNGRKKKKKSAAAPLP